MYINNKYLYYWPGNISMICIKEKKESCMAMRSNVY